MYWHGYDTDYEPDYVGMGATREKTAGKPKKRGISRKTSRDALDASEAVRTENRNYVYTNLIEQSEKDLSAMNPAAEEEKKRNISHQAEKLMKQLQEKENQEMEAVSQAQEETVSEMIKVLTDPKDEKNRLEEKQKTDSLWNEVKSKLDIEAEAHKAAENAEEIEKSLYNEVKNVKVSNPIQTMNAEAEERRIQKRESAYEQLMGELREIADEKKSEPVLDYWWMPKETDEAVPQENFMKQKPEPEEEKPEEKVPVRAIPARPVEEGKPEEEKPRPVIDTEQVVKTSMAVKIGEQAPRARAVKELENTVHAAAKEEVGFTTAEAPKKKRRKKQPATPEMTKRAEEISAKKKAAAAAAAAAEREELKNNELRKEQKRNGTRKNSPWLVTVRKTGGSFWMFLCALSLFLSAAATGVFYYTDTVGGMEAAEIMLDVLGSGEKWHKMVPIVATQPQRIAMVATIIPMLLLAIGLFLFHVSCRSSKKIPNIGGLALAGTIIKLMVYVSFVLGGIMCVISGIEIWRVTGVEKDERFYYAVGSFAMVVIATLFFQLMIRSVHRMTVVARETLRYGYSNSNPKWFSVFSMFLLAGIGIYQIVAGFFRMEGQTLLLFTAKQLFMVIATLCAMAMFWKICSRFSRIKRSLAARGSEE